MKLNCSSEKLERYIKLLDMQNEAPEIVYYPSLFCQLSLPMARTDEGLFTRDSGQIEMQLRTTCQLPYGSIARRILYYTANHLTQNGTVNWPKSQAALLKAMTLGNSGTDVKRFKTQFNALSNTRFTVIRDGHQIIDDAFLFQRLEMPDQTKAFPQLSEAIKKHIYQSCTPLSKSAVEALIKTPFAFDLYTWLTWRAVSLKKPMTRISWRQLHSQFASNQNLSSFKQSFKRQLMLVMQAYPAITDKVFWDQSILTLKRYQPHIQPYQRQKAIHK
ncbi:replication protein RepA [Pseudoalteromonas nigrifaciens]|uniref:replication protein RepA n=3 Tax=Pseudoalteromonas nigrifaciens TaxID=28109 RepID=UPI003FD60EE9